MSSAALMSPVSICELQLAVGHTELAELRQHIDHSRIARSARPSIHRRYLQVPRISFLKSSFMTQRKVDQS